MIGLRHRAACVSAVLLVLGPGCSRRVPEAPTPPASAAQHEGHDHTVEAPAPPTLEEIAAAAERLGDPGEAARIARVRLIGAIEFPASGGRLPIEEVGEWPGRYELRLRGTAAADPVLQLGDDGVRVSLPAAWPAAFRPDDRFALLRLRSLFVLRHLASALAVGAAPAATDDPAGNVVALLVADGRGTFALLWGGPRGGLLALDDGAARMRFPAFFRAGRWFLPAMQSYEVGGELPAIVYATRVETVVGP